MPLTYEELENGYDVEIFLANACIRNKIPVISPKRCAKYVDWKKIDSIDKFALHLNGQKQRILKTLTYIKTNNVHTSF